MAAVFRGRSLFDSLCYGKRNTSITFLNTIGKSKEGSNGAYKGLTRCPGSHLYYSTRVDQPRGEGVASLNEKDNNHTILSNDGMYVNRNPRNFELMGMERKPLGYSKGLWRVDYYHRLMLVMSLRHVTGYVNYNDGLQVVEASTREYCIARHLYKTTDVCAAYNVGRVLAARCKEMGLYRMIWEHKRHNRRAAKVKAFLRAFSEAGIELNEPRVKQNMPPPGELPKGLNINKTIVDNLTDFF